MKSGSFEQYLTHITQGELVTLLDSISDALFLDDENGITLWLNGACEELFQIKREDVIGRTIYELEDDGVFSPSVAKMVLLEKKQCTILHKNKQGKTILSTGIPILNKKNDVKKIITTSRDISELIMLKDELEYTSQTIADLKSQDSAFCENLIVSSPAMYSVVQLARQLTNIDTTILLCGESGCGKGAIAKYIYESGNRSKGPFVHINCGAIPHSLLESELFGYEKGAFTGSNKEGKIGLFEAAQDGILFLDEISELPLTMQVKLLQAIQEKIITRVGGLTPISINVRIIAAANKDLQSEVQAGTFREDLYYRLNVVPITIPPLRERVDDIIPLIRFFLKKHCAALGVTKTIDQGALSILMSHTWPGNVRELENIIERLVITTAASTITPSNIPSYINVHSGITGESSSFAQGFHPKNLNLKNALQQVEKAIFKEAMQKYSTTREIAKALGISQPSVVRKMKNL